MKILKIVLGSLAAIVALLLIVISLRPDDFRVSRTGSINAPASVVFENVNDLHKWQIWSPWAKMDPHAKNTFEGPPTGTGSAFTWSGNDKVGEGTMTITESRPHDRVLINLEFRKPFAGTNLTEFTFRPEGNQTFVTWTMSGKANFMAKAVGLIIDCDKLIGPQFEEGLANLRSVSEAVARQTASAAQP